VTRVPSLAPASAVAEASRLLDEARSGAVATALLVFASPALVVGSGQPLASIRADVADADHVAVIRRGSGGGAVLCDAGLLEVDVAVPAGHALAIDDVAESYRWFGEAWTRALAALGVPACLVLPAEARALDDDRRAAGRVACYASLSPYEVVTPDGRKLVGLCQRRRGGAIVYQSSVAVTGSPQRVGRYLVAGEVPGLELAVSLADLGHDLSVATVAAAVEPTLPR
jgi:lipoate-protein ligase A